MIEAHRWDSIRNSDNQLVKRHQRDKTTCWEQKEKDKQKQQDIKRRKNVWGKHKHLHHNIAGLTHQILGRIISGNVSHLHPFFASDALVVIGSSSIPLYFHVLRPLIVCSLWLQHCGGIGEKTSKIVWMEVTRRGEGVGPGAGEIGRFYSVH